MWQEFLVPDTQLFSPEEDAIIMDRVETLQGSNISLTITHPIWNSLGDDLNRNVESIFNRWKTVLSKIGKQKNDKLVRKS